MTSSLATDFLIIALIAFLPAIFFIVLDLVELFNARRKKK
jgi:hypothetical protein